MRISPRTLNRAAQLHVSMKPAKPLPPPAGARPPRPRPPFAGLQPAVRRVRTVKISMQLHTPSVLGNCALCILSGWMLCPVARLPAGAFALPGLWSHPLLSHAHALVMSCPSSAPFHLPVLLTFDFSPTPLLLRTPHPLPVHRQLQLPWFPPSLPVGFALPCIVTHPSASVLVLHSLRLFFFRAIHLPPTEKKFPILPEYTGLPNPLLQSYSTAHNFFHIPLFLSAPDALNVLRQLLHIIFFP